MDISSIPVFSTLTQIIDYTNGSSIFYDSVTDVIRKIIEEHYLVKYPNTAFLCTPCYPYFSFYEDTMITKDIVKPYEQIIFINVDHYENPDYANRIFNWIRDIGVTEVWEWQISILPKYPDYIKPILKFMPMRYTSYYKPYAITQKDIRYIFAFAGNTKGRRQEFIDEYSENYVPYKIVNAIPYAPNAHEFEHCACVLNIHGSPGNFQEQLRICELLCLNVPVVSEVSDINYFEGLISEVPTDKLTKIPDLLADDEIILHTNPAPAYKELTYTDEAFERYRVNLLLKNPR